MMARCPAARVAGIGRRVGIERQNRSEPALPSAEQGDRKAEREEHEYELQARMRQLEDVEECVADFECQPADDEISGGNLEYTPAAQFHEESHLIFLVRSDAELRPIFAQSARHRTLARWRCRPRPVSQKCRVETPIPRSRSRTRTRAGLFRRVCFTHAARTSG